MKKLLLKCTIILSVLIFSINSYAQKEYTVLRTGAEITIDAVGDEAVWAGANELFVSSNDISDHHDPDCMYAEDDYDISATYKLLYNDTAIFMLIVVFDDVVMYQDGTQACGTGWHVDGIEYYYITTNDATPEQTVGGNNEIGGTHTRLQINTDGSVQYGDPGDGAISSIAIIETDDGYTCELSLNLEAFLSFRVAEPVTITPGTTQMGFDAFINDSDTDDGSDGCADESCREALIGWNNHDNGVYNDASKSGKINFSDEFAPGSSSVNYTQLSNTEVYPNPAEDKVFIKSSINLGSIEIVNIIGEKVLQVNDYSNGIDISALSPGIYMIKANDFITRLLIK